MRLLEKMWVNLSHAKRVAGEAETLRGNKITGSY